MKPEPRPRNAAKRDDHIHHRTGRGDGQFLGWFFRHPLQSRHPADGQQGDVRRVNAEGFCHQRVSELVQDNADEEEQDQDRPKCRFRRPA